MSKLHFLNEPNEPISPSEIYQDLEYELKKSMLKIESSLTENSNIIKSSVIDILAYNPVYKSGKNKPISYINHISKNPGKAYRYKLAKHLGLSYISENQNEIEYSDSINRIAKISELLHILSLVVDDYIDGDVMRHGDIALHKMFNSHSIITVTDLISSAIYRLINEMKLNYQEKSDMLMELEFTCKKLTCYFKAETKWQFDNHDVIDFKNVNIQNILDNYIIKGGGISLFTVKAISIINKKYKKEILNYSAIVKNLAILLQRSNDLENLAPYTFNKLPNVDRFTDLKERRCTYLPAKLSKENVQLSNYINLLYNEKNIDLSYEYYEKLIDNGIIKKEINKIDILGKSISENDFLQPEIKDIIESSVNGYIEQMKNCFGR